MADQSQPGLHATGSVRGKAVETVDKTRKVIHESGGARGRRLEIAGHHVGNRHVNLMSNSGHYRRWTMRNRQRDLLAVKRSKIGLCSPAAHHSNGIYLEAAKGPETPHDVGNRVHTLHPRIKQPHLPGKPALLQLVHEISVSRTTGAGNQTDTQRHQRNREGRITGQVTLLGELANQPGAFRSKLANSEVGVDPRHPELDHPSRRIVRDSTADSHRNAVGHPYRTRPSEHPVHGYFLRGE